EKTVQQYLATLSEKDFVQSTQGIWFQSGHRLLVSNQGTTPLPAASLTKIATSLAALETWGANHRFETRFGITGPIQAGVVQGDLVVQGSGNPFFIWEEAIAVGNALQKRGIQRINGNLVIADKFYMNYESDPTTVGKLLLQGLNAKIWSPEAEAQYLTLPKGTARPQIEIAGSVQVAQQPLAKQLVLLRHQSLTLAQILKLVNIYSNNPMSEMLAESVGGAAKVAEKAALMAGVPVSEIQLVNGSGLGEENKISPRATCAMLIAIERYLKSSTTPQGGAYTIADLFPVSGLDQQGTLAYRQIPVNAAVKTGTLNQVSALAGVLPTRDRGLVYFSIINRGGDLEGFRNQQDRLLQDLLQAWGTATSLPTALKPNREANESPKIGG
ncbi:MAG: D-alanyl-D-alanine carboxypeptidase, partial [Leptolyngbyaceae bacterium]|nr:D-alanyl-D-alanine carboxypeptidase [Leptolyngbyaceae bacterium]